MPSGLSSGLRNSSLILFAALLTGALLAPGSVDAQSPSAVGNPNIYFKPPAPVLPSAGGQFVDPTFGTTIVRITDPSNAPYGAGVNSAAQDSMFNADASLFYLHINDGGGNGHTVLCSLNRTTGQATILGTIPGPSGKNVSYDGARWDPTNPAVLYAVVTSSTTRELWQLTFPFPGTAVLLHDFSNEIPTGGYPYSRVGASQDSRYFAITASTTGGQDTYDYVVIWDRQTGATKILNTPSRIGTVLHSMVLDNSGQYAILERADYTGSYIWNWPSDTLSPLLGIGLPYAFGGHKIPGTGQVISPGLNAGEWVSRSLATPASFAPILVWPKKNGKSDYFEDSHSSRLLTGQKFGQTRYISAFSWISLFNPYSGNIYRLTGYLAYSSDFDVPETVRYKGSSVPRVSGIPTGPNQWWYDSSSDSLYLWLPDSSDPRVTAAAVSIFDWRPLMEEIVQVAFDGTAWQFRRLAHHRAQFTGLFSSTPRGNADPTGAFVLFQSNWDNTLRNADNSSRQDAFLLLVPPIGGTALPAPSGLVVSP